MNCTQDITSAKEIGTLFHWKNYFEERNVTGNVKESFNFNEEFLDFCTEGYMTLLSLHNLDMDNLADTPDVEDKVACLHYISSKVIDKVFLSISSVVQDITKAGERAQKWVLSFLWQQELLKSSRVPYWVCRQRRRHSGGCIVFEWWLWTREVN